MSIDKIHHCDYTCNACNHTWQDSKERGFEDSAYKYGGCPSCNSKDCQWETQTREDMTAEQVTALQSKLHSPARLGKPPKEFVDQVLGRIHDHHKGIKGETTINRDW